MSETKDKSVQLFLDELASKNATPGGGSVAALMGAQSAALISMVCNLTIGKPNYEEVDAQMRTLLGQSEMLREHLTSMVKADIDVFNRLMSAYSSPKETDEEKALRSELIQSILKDATEVPLACAKACKELIALSQVAANLGNLGVISDAGVAVIAASSGLKSAALNVYVNTGCLKDTDYAATKITELEAILAGTDTSVEEIYQLVKTKL